MEAPEKIWVEDADRRHTRAGMPYLAFRQPEDATDTEYTRSDLCTMPGELVEEWKSILYGTPIDAFNNRDDDGLISPAGNGDKRIIEAIQRTLAWHEGRKG